MRSIILKKIFYFIFILVVTSCSNNSGLPPEYEDFVSIDFGEGIYRPNPFKFCDNIPPFSWMGMPDSVKKETKLKISFNEDAIRSHSSGQLALIDHNGNKVNGVCLSDSISNKIGFEAKAGIFGVPVSVTVNPEVGDSILRGSLVVISNDLDQVNGIRLPSMATPIASWTLTHKIGINWVRWTILVVCVCLFACMAYFLVSIIVKSISSLVSGIPKYSVIKNSDNHINNDKKKKNKETKNRNPFIVWCEQILLSQASVSDKAVALERLFNYWDYELPDKDKDYEAKMLDSRIMNAMEELWKKYYKYTKKNMSWSGEKLDSILVPNKDTIPPNKNYSNIDNLTWGQIMKKHNYNGLMYRKGKPDFSKLAQYTVVINDFEKFVDPNKDDERGPLQEHAFDILTQNKFPDYGIEYVKKSIKERNRLVWHEDTDCKTLYLVPQEIHNNLHHFGGIGMLRILRNCGLVNTHMDITIQESKLYENRPVAEKYSILEAMRLELDRLYREDRQAYDKCRAALKENTWEALEENWKLWDPAPAPAPKSNVVWEGKNDCTCRLLPSHPQYAECAAQGFTVCEYDLHGSPNFDAVTFPGSIVDISDLYDKLSSDNIQKRGGGPNSLQEIAQERMVRNLERTIREWAKANHCEADFWTWRDTMNLVPHEDTDCRTMRLVYRPAHLAFKHRGGVSNAINIKNHFNN